MSGYAPLLENVSVGSFAWCEWLFGVCMNGWCVYDRLLGVCLHQ